MSEIKVGDVVDVAFRAVVVNHTQHTVRVRYHAGGLDSIAIWRSEATKPKPELPTAFGSVVRDESGEVWILATSNVWYSSDDDDASSAALAKRDFEVIRDGV